MEINELLDMYRYEVGIIVNNNRDTILVTDDLNTANYYYEKAIKKYSPNNDKNHTIIFLYDYDKNTNINYFDNESDVC